MKCFKIQEKLSEYHDGELSGAVHDLVAAHLADCPSCAAQLAELERYSEAFRQLSPPEVPPSLWAGIAAELDRESVQLSPAASGSDRVVRPRLTAGRWTLAATILLVLGLGFWMTRQGGHADHSAEFVQTMDRYWSTLASDPDRAEQMLLDKYDGQSIEPEGAVGLVGYRPAIASGLPDQYTLASTSVLRMPCCTCVKAVCKRRDGSTLVLFEHDEDDSQWFGHRQSHTAVCGDTQCCLVDLDTSIAATWRRGSRWVTAVGVHGTDEVGELVSWFDEKVHAESNASSAL